MALAEKIKGSRRTFVTKLHAVVQLCSNQARLKNGKEALFEFCKYQIEKRNSPAIAVCTFVYVSKQHCERYKLITFKFLV